eukprot:2104003-Pleurochrysis_carterae.AAC.2
MAPAFRLKGAAALGLLGIYASASYATFPQSGDSTNNGAHHSMRSEPLCVRVCVRSCAWPCARAYAREYAHKIV